MRHRLGVGTVTLKNRYTAPQARPPARSAGGNEGAAQKSQNQEWPFAGVSGFARFYAILPRGAAHKIDRDSALSRETRFFLTRAARAQLFIFLARAQRAREVQIRKKRAARALSCRELV